MKWLIWLNISPNITPAAPASTEPMKNVAAMTRLTSMPIIAAASWSNAVARHRLPERGLGDEQGERDHQRDARRQHGDLDPLEVDARDREDGLHERTGLERGGLSEPSWNDW